MKTINKCRVLIFGYGISLSMFVLLYLQFIVAFFNDYKVLVVINKFGEAYLEFILIPVFLVFSLIGFIMIIKDYKERYY